MKRAILQVDPNFLAEAARLIEDEPRVGVIGSCESVTGYFVEGEGAVRLLIEGDLLPDECVGPGSPRVVIMECISLMVGDHRSVQISGFRVLEFA